jgi:diaminohydroxyphosphoribosylaminopyrimidine deaminase / 5-amino-6-(5-phosphoribosylamino)uracil reductase
MAGSRSAPAKAAGSPANWPANGFTFSAVMIGVGTALADDPELTCRLPGMTARQPVRIVVDGGLKLDLTARLVAGAREAPTWIVTRSGLDPTRQDGFRAAGVELIELPPTPDEFDFTAVLRALGDRGLTRVLVEGGARLAASLLRANLVDRIAWFRAPAIIGGDGIGAVAPLGLANLAEAPRFRRVSIETVGDDVLETLTRRL